MTDERPGFFWCNECREYIPNVFTDHEEQHAVAGGWVDLDRAAPFWALCAESGVIAGLLVAALT